MAKDLRAFCEKNGFSNKRRHSGIHDEPMPESIVYTTKQMASLLNMSEQSVRNLIKENGIPTIPGTKNILVRKATFDAFISQY